LLRKRTEALEVLKKKQKPHNFSSSELQSFKKENSNAE